jgi:aminoglycoside 3-N-acetyltransferase I
VKNTHLDFRCQKLSSVEDVRKLLSIFDIVFEKRSSPSTERLTTVCSDNAVFNLGAFVDGALVGGLSAHELALVSGEKEFYLYDIGVLPEYQKKGIGTCLIRELKKEARMRGVSTIFVEAESEDEGAVAFYRSLGEEEVFVRHFNLKV